MTLQLVEGLEGGQLLDLNQHEFHLTTGYELYVCTCVCVCMRGCMCACACMRACVCACVCVHSNSKYTLDFNIATQLANKQK